MSTHLVVEPVNAGESGFVDGAAHRKPMAGAYNQYRAVSADPRDARGEEAQMLLQPLFVTAFLIDDFLAQNQFFGARTAVLSSASSKTAFGLAHQLAQRRAIEVVGLTSPRNAAFVSSLGCYDRTLPYGELAALDPSVPALFVDMAGNGAVQSAVHHHFGKNLVHSLSVGLTHWEHGKRESGLPGAAPSFFFAPDHLRKRFGDWGPRASSSGSEARSGHSADSPTARCAPFAAGAPTCSASTWTRSRAAPHPTRDTCSRCAARPRAKPPGPICRYVRR